MSYLIEFTLDADKYFTKLDHNSKKLLQNYLNQKVLSQKHPKNLGKALVGDFKGLWRYRVNKFRIICRIKEDKLIILILKIGTRAKIYD